MILSWLSLGLTSWVWLGQRFWYYSFCLDWAVQASFTYLKLDINEIYLMYELEFLWTYLLLCVYVFFKWDTYLSKKYYLSGSYPGKDWYHLVSFICLYIWPAIFIKVLQSPSYTLIKLVDPFSSLLTSFPLFFL